MPVRLAVAQVHREWRGRPSGVSINSGSGGVVHCSPANRLCDSQSVGTYGSWRWGYNVSRPVMEACMARAAATPYWRRIAERYSR